jgi:hypothetical protein
MANIAAKSPVNKLKRPQSRSTVWKESRSTGGYHMPGRVRPDLSMAAETSSLYMRIQRIRDGGAE